MLSGSVWGPEGIHSLDFAIITFLKDESKLCFVERCDFSLTIPMPDSEISCA